MSNTIERRFNGGLIAFSVMSTRSQSPYITGTTGSIATVRTSVAPNAPMIAGYAAVFDQWSEDLGNAWTGPLFERIAAGAFADTLVNDDIRALFNHDTNHVLGRNRAGTLTLREDPRGLYIEATPPDTQIARDVLALIQRGDISQMSFAFTVLEDVWRFDREADIVYRTIQKVRLYEVSPVTFPAYPQTSVDVLDRAQQCRSEQPAILNPENHADAPTGARQEPPATNPVLTNGRSNTQQALALLQRQIQLQY